MAQPVYPSNLTGRDANTSEIVTALVSSNRISSEILKTLQQLFPRVSGSFTMSATDSQSVSEANVAGNSIIQLIPTNASAAVLQGSNECLYVSAISPGVSFTVSTGAGTNAAGTETFAYLITTPV